MKSTLRLVRTQSPMTTSGPGTAGVGVAAGVLLPPPEQPASNAVTTTSAIEMEKRTRVDMGCAPYICPPCALAYRAMKSACTAGPPATNCDVMIVIGAPSRVVAMPPASRTSRMPAATSHGDTVRCA